MYKELKKQLADKKIIEDEIFSINQRMRFIIENQLGLHASSLAEIKIQIIGTNQDKFAKVFSKVEVLEKDFNTLVGEKKIIEELLEKVVKDINSLNDKEQQIFKCRYILGLTQKETAERLNYGIDRIKQIDSEIAKKC